MSVSVLVVLVEDCRGSAGGAALRPERPVPSCAEVRAALAYAHDVAAAHGIGVDGAEALELPPDPDLADLVEGELRRLAAGDLPAFVALRCAAKLVDLGGRPGLSERALFEIAARATREALGPDRYLREERPSSPGEEG